MPGKKQFKPGTPKPFCKCGCGQRVRAHRNQWIGGHMTPQDWSAMNRMRDRLFVYKIRRARFAKDLDALTRSGRSVSREDLADMMADVYKRAYDSGYHAAEKKWRFKTGAHQEAA
jgi:hypothetical protein